MQRSLFSAWLVVCLTGISNSIVQDSYGQSSLIDSIINPSSVQQLVGVLASDSFKGRFTGTEQAAIAAEFIAGEFRKAGALPLDIYDGYTIPFEGRTKTQIGLNVIAALEGHSKRQEVIIFCAHYDHIGSKSINPFKDFVPNRLPKRGDTIFNGANDNASGTSAIINLARYFGYLKNNERTILFIAFSGEELGLLGSKAFAMSLNPEAIKAVINIEMIGRPRARRKKNAYMTGSQFSNLRKLLNKKLLETDSTSYGKKFFTDDTYANENLFARSDNFWFANQGIPAHTIMASSPQDKFYHSTGDEIATLDFVLMSNLVKAIALSSTGLIDGSETPTRINRGTMIKGLKD